MTLSIWIAAGADAQTCGWSASGLTLGIQGQVNALHVWDPDGPGAQPPRLMVGGYNLLVPGTSQTTSMLQYFPATNTWSAMNPAPVGQVMDIAEAPNRTLIVCGSFGTVGALSANNIARLSTSGSWSALGSGLPDRFGFGWVRSVDVYPNGDVAACGLFSTAVIGGASSLSRWNGSSWASWTNGSQVFEVTVTPQNTLLVAAEGGLGGMNGLLGFYDGSAWTLLGDIGCAYIHVIERLSNGEYLLGGTFYNPLNSGALSIARMSADGLTFSPFGPGFERIGGIGRVAAILPRPGGEIIVGGDFELSGTQPMNRISRWNGSTWLPIGSGISHYPGFSTPNVLALAALPDGRIAVGGFFGIAGGVTSPGIAFWTPTYPAVFSAQPAPRTVVCPGMAATLAVEATGTAPISYAWQAGLTFSGPWVTLTQTPQPLQCPGGGPGLSAASASDPTAASTSILLRPCTDRARLTSFYIRARANSACDPTYSNNVFVVYCPADFNCSRTLSIGDVFEFVAAWFAGDLRADMNGNGDLSVQDVFDFLAAWFAGC